MPRYFFDISEPEGLVNDGVGSECANDKVMRETCLRTICEIAAETLWQSEPPRYQIIVRDVDNREIYTVSLNLIERGKLAA
jgi:hypothetical protein